MLGVINSLGAGIAGAGDDCSVARSWLPSPWQPSDLAQDGDEEAPGVLLVRQKPHTGKQRQDAALHIWWLRQRLEAHEL